MSTNEKTKEVKVVNIGTVLRPDPPVRDHFDEQELERLSDSIRENGVLVPLMVREKGDNYEVVDGDRRLNACWKAGLREIPVVVHALDDSQTHVQRMLANLDRHDPDPVSEAKYIAQVVASGAYTPDEFAQKLGRTTDWVEGRLTIAEMPEYMRQALSSQAIGLGVAMELHQIKDESTKERYFKEAVRSGMTVHTAKINRMMVNEAIESLKDRGEEVTEEATPAPQVIPKVRCALTGEVLPVTSTQMIRVGVANYREFQRSIQESDRDIASQ